MNIIPLGKYIVLKKYIPEEPKKSILIVETKNKAKHLGEIIETSDDVVNPKFYPGCIVQYISYKEIPVENHDDLILVNEDDIIAIHS